LYAFLTFSYRTLAILSEARKKALRGPHIHEVYIDECQDNQIVDLALILKLFNSADNFFMAGDIAQCINRGSSFRFQSMYRFSLRIKNDVLPLLTFQNNYYK
jgi:superfamily I DNA/RNA helicase